MFAICEPVQYWYKDSERQLDDVIVKNKATQFPFREFFVVTWLLNTLVGMVKACVEKKPILLIERDYSDHYSLGLWDLTAYHESYAMLDSMKRNFGRYIVFKFITKLPLMHVMSENLVARGTIELEALSKPEYVSFVNAYEANFKAIHEKFKLQAYPNVIVKEFWVERFLSEMTDEIKCYLNKLKC